MLPLPWQRGQVWAMEKGPCETHLAGAAQAGQVDGCCARARAAAFARLARRGRDADLGLEAVRRLLERELHVVAQVGAAEHGRASAAPPPKMSLKMSLKMSPKPGPPCRQRYESTPASELVVAARLFASARIS